MCCDLMINVLGCVVFLMLYSDVCDCIFSNITFGMYLIKHLSTYSC